MDRVQVWSGAYGDPEPLFGPLPGIRHGNAIAYEFALPERFEPKPGRTRLERVFILADFGVSMAQPCWRREVRADGTVVRGLDGDRRWQRFLDSCLHRDRDPSGTWPDFPPRAIKDLAALPGPLGPVVTFGG